MMSHTLSNVEPWLRDGKPSGAVLEQFDGPEPQLLEGKRRNFSPAKAWPRVERRLASHQSAPFPSSYAKAQMRAQIEALAMQGAPNDPI